MPDLEVKITVQNTGGAGGEAQAAGVETKESEDNAKTAFTVNQALRVAERLSKQIATNVIGSIGTFSGNYVLQERVEQGLNIGTKLVGVGVAFAANPVLGAVALVGEGIDLGFQVAKYQRQIQWQNANATELRRRAGYLSNGNRGSGR